MVFSSLLFLFFFLPAFLTGYYAAPARLKNLWAVAASLLFYLWGEPRASSTCWWPATLARLDGISRAIAAAKEACACGAEHGWSPQPRHQPGAARLVQVRELLRR